MTTYTQETKIPSSEKNTYITLTITPSTKCAVQVTQVSTGLITIEEATGTSRIVLSPQASVGEVTLKILEVDKEPQEKLITDSFDNQKSNLVEAIEKIEPIIISTESAVDFSGISFGYSLRIELQDILEVESTSEILSDDYCCIPCDGFQVCACAVSCPNGGGSCCSPKCRDAGVC